MSKLNQDQELMRNILAKEWHTLYAEEIILVMNYAKEQQAIIDDLIYKAKLRESDHQALLVKYQATKKCWEDVGGKCEELKTQLNNMEACYIEKKKQVEAVDAVLMNWRDEYTEFAHQHECTVDAVLRTCIAELEQALRGDNA